MDDKTLISLVEKFGASDLAELTLADGATRLVLRKETAIRAIAAAAAVGAQEAPGAAGAQGAAGTLVTLSALGVSGAQGAQSALGAPGAPVHLGLPARIETSNDPASLAASAGEMVTSPIVATFYASPTPDAPAYAPVGKRVKSGETLCILEAMKMMNHLEAEFDCEIISVKAKNGDLVEYGQSIFEVKRT